MTQPGPANPLDDSEEELSPPLLERMISSPFFPELVDQDGNNKTPVVWRRGKAHPLTSNTEVIRMFLTEEGVEIYAVEKVRGGGIRGVRNFVPMHYVRLTEEHMHPDIMREEIEAAEARAEARATEYLSDDPEPEGYPEPESTPTVPPPPPVPSNGQVAP